MEPAPTGVTFLGQQIDIDLHGATTTRAQPFVFTFELDASALFDPDTFEPVEPQNVGVYRSGELVPDCTVADGTVEEPNANPCVSSRTETATGGVVIVVLTTMASPWNLSTTRPFAVRGFLSPVEIDGVNVVKAGRTVPVKFSLAGDRGLDVLAADSPSSVPVACPDDPSPEAGDGGSGDGGLSYDPAVDEYTWHWRTSADWRGCRRFDLTLVDGPTLSATFRFR